MSPQYHDMAPALWAQAWGECADPVALLNAEACLAAVNPAFAAWIGPEAGARIQGSRLIDWLAATERERFALSFDELMEQQGTRALRLVFSHAGPRLTELVPLGYASALLIVRPALSEAADARFDPQLIQTQKMETIGRLAGGLAHSLNNTLMGVIGYCELAMMDIEDKHPVKFHLETIKQIGEKASELSRQLLAYSRKQQLHLQPTHLGEMITRMEPMLRHWLGAKAWLITHCRDEAAVHGDVNQLEQVVMNLVFNARDAMEQGGHLEIETRDLSVDEALAQAFPGLKAGCYGMLKVRDNGSGMAPEVLANIFEPFFTTKGRGQGSGLGLATVYGVVKQHDGYIGVASVQGQGSCFTVLIPAPAGIAAASVAGVDLQGRYFWLLSQDKAWTHYCAKLLRDAGAQVLIGWSALTRWRKLAAPLPHIEVVLVDEENLAGERARIAAAGLARGPGPQAYGRLLGFSELAGRYPNEGQALGDCLPRLLPGGKLLACLVGR